jgi:protein involved in sex pheromone biosynthesis
MSIKITYILLITTLLILIGCAKQPNDNDSNDDSLKTISGIITKIDYQINHGDDNWSATIVYFKDGRVRAFNGLSKKTFRCDRLNHITYKDINYESYIVKVEIINQ